MRWLDACERAISAAVEQWPLRAFGARLEPVHLRRALERLMDEERLVWSHGPMVPNRFVILLNPDDLKRFTSVSREVERELASAVHVSAVRNGWHMSGPPQVTLEPDASLRPRSVVARIDEQPIESPEMGAAIVAPTAKIPRAQLSSPTVRLTLADGTDLSHSVLPITIGRGSGNVVVIDDPRISRRHAEVYREGASLGIRDLGSTNGTWVGGERIQQRRIEGALDVLLGGYPLSLRVLSA